MSNIYDSRPLCPPMSLIINVGQKYNGRRDNPIVSTQTQDHLQLVPRRIIGFHGIINSCYGFLVCKSIPTGYHHVLYVLRPFHCCNAKAPSSQRLLSHFFEISISLSWCSSCLMLPLLSCKTHFTSPMQLPIADIIFVLLHRHPKASELASVGIVFDRNGDVSTHISNHLFCHLR